MRVIHIILNIVSDQRVSRIWDHWGHQYLPATCRIFHWNFLLLSWSEAHWMGTNCKKKCGALKHRNLNIYFLYEKSMAIIFRGLSTFSKAVGHYLLHQLTNKSYWITVCVYMYVRYKTTLWFGNKMVLVTNLFVLQFGM